MKRTVTLTLTVKEAVALQEYIKRGATGVATSGAGRGRWNLMVYADRLLKKINTALAGAA